MTIRHEIRDAVPGDELAVAHVHVRAWQHGYRGLLPDGYLDGLRPADRAARYTFADRTPGRPHTLVAVAAQHVIGFATVAAARDQDAPGAGELAALHVDPDHWRRGLGRELVVAARDRLAAAGHQFAVVWVLAGNARAMSFYIADGWVADGARRRDTVWNVEVEEIRCRRRLP